MTKQEIYDRVCAHLAQQKVQSRITDEDGVGKCLYRGPNGTSCAIGCLITDEEYDPKMDIGDGTGVYGMMDFYPHIATKFGRENRLFLDALQQAHDDCYKPEDIKATLMVIAEINELQAGAEQAITQWGKPE